MPKKKEASASPFVPVEEQPHPIPENWCWVKLEGISEIIMGQSPVGSDTTDDSSYMPLIGGAADMGIMYPLATRYTKVPTKISKNGDLILCIRATLGKPIFSDGEYCLGRGVAVIRPYIGEKEFYRYFFLTFEQYLYDNATGTTFAQVNSKTLQKMPVPLPSLPEQHRIVTRIESLFAKLDEAKEKAQAVVDGFELRKSAILHKAFTGELTERWRREHGVGLDSWKNTTLSEMVSGFKYGTSEKNTYNNSGMPVLRIPNVGTGTLCFEDMKYLAHNDVDEANQVHENDLLIIRSNGSRDLVGKCAIVPALSRKFAYASFLIRIKPSERILPDYLALYLNSTDARTQMFKKAKSSAGIHNINSQELGSITINVPTIYEQSTIIAVLNNLLAKEQQAKEAAEAILAQIDTMKKAILARAFRGELGTNDPAEEWAGELLKKVL